MEKLVKSGFVDSNDGIDAFGKILPPRKSVNPSNQQLGDFHLPKVKSSTIGMMFLGWTLATVVILYVGGHVVTKNLAKTIRKQEKGGIMDRLGEMAAKSKKSKTGKRNKK